MPFNGSGGFDSLAAPIFPAVAGTTITSSYYNAQLNDVFSGLGMCITRDGQSPATANLPMAGFKHTGAGDANAAGQYMVWGQSAAAFGLGSAAAPSIAFLGDSNTGFWSPGADQIAASTAGTQRLWLNNTGLGVGITPAARFHSNGAAVGEQFRLTSTGTARLLSAALDANGSWFGNSATSLNGEGLYYQASINAIRAYTASVERWRTDANGNTAFGVTPLAGVIVMGHTGTNRNVGFSDLGANATVAGLTDAGAPSALQLSGSTLIFTPDGAAEAGRMLTTGNFLLGRTTDSTFGLLQVQGQADFAPSSGVARIANRAVAAASSILSLAGNGNTVGTNSFDLQQDTTGQVDIVQRFNGRMSFYTNSLERVRIESTGHTIPGANNTYNLGATGTRWANVISVLGNYTGALTAASFDTAAATDLQLRPAGASRIVVTTDGRLYGNALHNNAGAMTGVANQYIGSGTYTPVLTNATNTSALSAGVFRWIRLGNVVHAIGRINSTATVTGVTATQLYMTLPIASNLASIDDLQGVCLGYGNGTGSGPSGDCTRVIGDTVGDRALVSWNGVALAGSQAYTVSFSYEVLA